jgi:MFS family permease
VAGNPRSWPPALCSAGIYGGFGCFIGLWGVPYMTQVYGLDRLAASNLVALAAVGLLVGAPLAGFASDRLVGRRRPFLVCAATLEVAVWCAVVLPRKPLPSWCLGPLCFALGLSSAGLAIVFATIREVNDPRHVGMAMGVQNTPVFFGFALMQWITGAALDARWAGASLAGARVYPLDAYRLAFAICLAVSVGAVVASFFVAETRCRNVWRVEPGRAT